MKILVKLIAILALISLSQLSLAVDQAEKKPEMKMDHAMGTMDETNDGTFKNKTRANAENA